MDKFTEQIASLLAYSPLIFLVIGLKKLKMTVIQLLSVYLYLVFILFVLALDLGFTSSIGFLFFVSVFIILILGGKLLLRWGDEQSALEKAQQKQKLIDGAFNTVLDDPMGSMFDQPIESMIDEAIERDALKK